MASRPLRLEFTVDPRKPEKRVLPLTPENVTAVFQRDVLTKKDRLFSRALGFFLDIPRHLHNNPVAAAKWWVANCKDKRWRVLIFFLDTVGETRIADELSEYAEPLRDASITVEHIAPIFAVLIDWKLDDIYLGGWNIVPAPRVEVICGAYRSDSRQREQAAHYFVTINPFASWANLAACLFKSQEEKSMAVFRKQLANYYRPDPTLTFHNVFEALQEVRFWDRNDSYWTLDIPKATHNRIEYNEENNKSKLVHYFLDNHPFPTWQKVIKLVERLEEKRHARAGLALEISRKYPTRMPLLK